MNKNNLLTATLLISLLLPFANQLKAQGFTSNEYKKALWMTTRFYGGQRSGLNNWLLYDHLPAGVASTYKGKCFIDDKDTDGYDISGGWHDCGDHVKFGQTEFYSAYMLLKGYAEFPRGYDDLYAADYINYATANSWSYEGTGHAPNGIPDILDEVKHATDYFIKCAKNSSTFYYQVGQGDPDHTQWVTAVKMQTLTQANGGQPRTVYKNPADASMASFCGATLALMSRMYRKFDPAYADLCLKHAKYAYDYAKAHPGVAATGDGGFYSANDNWKDDYACMCAELHWATGTQAYKTEALAFSISYAPGMGTDIYGKNYGFDYTNNGDIAIYNLAVLGKSNGLSVLEQLVNTHYFGNVQTDGQFNGGNTGWGPLRYNANTAFIVALWQKLKGTSGTPNKYIYDNIDYILGKNASSQSFIVGFGSKSPKFPHHRNVYLRDDNPGDAAKRAMTIPAKNAQFGLMVGGTRNPSSYVDDVVTYTYSEGGIDYNACLVNSLAYIMSVLAPIDTNKFGHPSPDLGSDKTICGVSSIVLDSKVATDGVKTYTWYKDGTIVVAASKTAKTYNATSAGIYKCVLDSAGKWSTQGSVTILGVLPTINLGADVALCNPTSALLDMAVTGTGISYEWKKNNVVIQGAQSSTYTVYAAGTYKGTISASGCASKSDEVVVTSSLPVANFDTLCIAGSANLSVTGTGPYEWYNDATAGSLLKSGSTYTPNISKTTTYYVKDASSFSGSVGPTTMINGGTNWGINAGNQLKMTVGTSFNINSLKVQYGTIYNDNSTATVTLEILDGNGNSFTPAKTFTSMPKSVTTAMSNSLIEFMFTNMFIDKAWGTDLRIRINSHSTNGAIHFNLTGATFPYNSSPAGIVTITGAAGGDGNASNYMYLYDWKVFAGSTCGRTPVMAVIDPLNPSCTTTDVQASNLISEQVLIYPNPSTLNFIIQAPADAIINVFDNNGKMVYNSTNTSAFGETFTPGMYHVLVTKNNKVISSQNIIKE